MNSNKNENLTKIEYCTKIGAASRVGNILINDESIPEDRARNLLSIACFRTARLTDSKSKTPSISYKFYVNNGYDALDKNIPLAVTIDNLTKLTK